MIRAAVLAILLGVAPTPSYAQTAAECAVHLSPCHVDTRLYMAGIDDNQDARDFLAELKSAARSGDRERLAALVRYPLTMYDNGEIVAEYRDAQALLGSFDKVFTPGVLSAIEAAEYDTLFVNDQGAMIGDGEIWFDGWDGAVLIKTVNPPDERAASAPTPSSSSHPRGSVLWAQEALNALGYDAGPVDGAMGPRTRRAIEAFQRDHRLQVIGIIDQETVAALATGDGRSQPSFDCSKATTDVEVAICASETLSQLDSDLANAFAERRDALPAAEADQVLDRQRTWLAERDLCEGEIPCLEGSYRARLAELAESKAEAHAPAAENAPVKETSADASSTAPADPLPAAAELPAEEVPAAKAEEQPSHASGNCASCSVSENWARRSTELLNQGLRSEAIAAALKGLSRNPSDEDLARHDEAHLALYTAIRSDFVRLPLPDREPVESVVVSADRTRVVTTVGTAEGARKVELWDVESGRSLAVLVDSLATYHNAAPVFSDDGRYLAVPGNKGAVRFFEAADGRLIADLPAVRSVRPPPDDSPQFNSVGFNPSGTLLVTAGLYPPDLKVWSVPDLEVVLALDNEDLERIGRPSQAGNDVGATFADDDTLCVSIGKRQDPIVNFSSISVGSTDLPEGVFEQFHQLEGTFTSYHTRSAKAYCSADLSRAAMLYSNEEWVSQFDLVEVAGESPPRTIDNLRVGGMVFDQDARHVALQTVAGWDFLEAETGQKLDHHPGALDGFLLRHPRVYGTTGELVSEDYSSTLNYGARKVWQPVPTGVELITAALQELDDDARREVEAEWSASEGVPESVSPPENIVISSENWARRSTELLGHGQRDAALVAALKGLPADAGDGSLERFAPAHLALYTAWRSRVARLSLGDRNIGPYISSEMSFDQTRVVTTTVFPDGTNKVELWDAETGEVIAVLHDDLAIYQSDMFAFSIDGRHVAVPGGPGSIRLFDAADGTLIAELPILRPDQVDSSTFIYSVQFSPSGDLLLALSEDELRVWRVEDQQKVLSLSEADFTVDTRAIMAISVSFIDDDNLCVAASTPGTDALLFGIVDVHSGSTDSVRRIDGALEHYSGGAASAFCSGDGSLAAINYSDENIVSHLEIFDVEFNSRLLSFENVDASVSFNPDSRHFAMLTAMEYQFLKTASGEETKLPGSLQGFRMDGPRIFHRDTGEFAAYGGDDYVRSVGSPIWEEVPDGRELIDAVLDSLSEEQRAEIAAERVG